MSKLASIFFFFFGHSGDFKPARIRILPQGSLVPGILDNIQQIRQSVYSSYHQDRYRHLRCVFLTRLNLTPRLEAWGGSKVIITSYFTFTFTAIRLAPGTLAKVSALIKNDPALFPLFGSSLPHLHINTTKHNLLFFASHFNLLY